MAAHWQKRPSHSPRHPAECHQVLIAFREKFLYQALASLTHLSAGLVTDPYWTVCLPCCGFAPAAVRSESGCPDAAGLQLPASPWSGRVVSGAHLLSGKGDAAKWARCARLGVRFHVHGCGWREVAWGSNFMTFVLLAVTVDGVCWTCVYCCWAWCVQPQTANCDANVSGCPVLPLSMRFICQCLA